MHDINKLRLLIHDSNPLIHTITNSVTANDTANLLLACNAKPIMSELIEETDEIESISKALLINLGMPSRERIEVMIEAGKAANKHNVPVVFDPVGISISSARRTFSKAILEKVKVDVIKVNVSELKALADMYGIHDGDIREIAATLAKQTDTIMVVTDKRDIITDGINTYMCNNGTLMLSKVTGTGCMMGALIAAYIGVGREDRLFSTVSAVTTFNVAGEIAYERMTGRDGNATYRDYLIDGIHSMSCEELEERMDYESR